MPTEHEHEKESGPTPCIPYTRSPVQPILTSQSRLTRRLSAPPPYSAPVTPSVPEAPFPVTLKLSRLASRPEVPSRPLPVPPELETANFVEQAIRHQPQHISHTHVANSPPTRLRSPSVPTAISPSPFMSFSPPPPPPKPSPQIPSVSQNPRNANLRSAFRSFSKVKLSKASRNATTTNAARQADQDAQDEKMAEMARQAAAREEAKAAVQSSIMSLLLTRSSDEERKSAFSACGRICESGGLKLSTVLQEPLIEGQTPLYWAILNRPRTSSQDDNAAWDALVVALLDECGSLTETTITSVRLACMLTSNNVLLQYLFWHFRALSPLSSGDIMMLRPLGGGDIVDVEETQDGTGTFVANIKVRRFRLRMRVSKCVKVEFVTSGECSYHS
jgi:hypothetical protein